MGAVPYEEDWVLKVDIVICVDCVIDEVLADP